MPNIVKLGTLGHTQHSTVELVKQNMLYVWRQHLINSVLGIPSFNYGRTVTGYLPNFVTLCNYRTKRKILKIFDRNSKHKTIVCKIEE